MYYNYFLIHFQIQKRHLYRRLKPRNKKLHSIRHRQHCTVPYNHKILILVTLVTKLANQKQLWITKLQKKSSNQKPQIMPMFPQRNKQLYRIIQTRQSTQLQEILISRNQITLLNLTLLWNMVVKTAQDKKQRLRYPASVISEHNPSPHPPLCWY